MTPQELLNDLIKQKTGASRPDERTVDSVMDNIFSLLSSDRDVSGSANGVNDLMKRYRVVIAHAASEKSFAGAVQHIAETCLKLFPVPAKEEEQAK